MMELFEQDEQGARFELLPSKAVAQCWNLHDREENTYLWSMTLEEVNEYLRAIGVRPEDVRIMN